MYQPTIRITITVFVALLAGCTGSNPKESEKYAELPSTKPKANVLKSKTAIGGFMQVEDLEQWRNTYSSAVGESDRIGTFQNLDNMGTLLVIQWSENHQSAKAMIESAEVAEIYEKGTVKGAVEYRYYDMKYYNDLEIVDSLRLGVRMEVMSYDRWKTEFEKNNEQSAKAGLTLMGIATDNENTNLVSLLFAVSDRERAYDLLGSMEMQQTLTDAGVIGEPNITWWRSLP